jgi:hypothetical protein
LGSEVELDRYETAVCEKEDIISSFANKRIIMLGKNSGWLRIFNYDKNRRNEMAEMLQALMGDDLK